MNKQISKLMTGALITGLLAGSVALAEEGATKTADEGQQMSAGKDGCQGKTAKKDKNSCKGHAKAKKAKGKNGCNGKDGCNEKKKAEQTESQ